MKFRPLTILLLIGMIFAGCGEGYRYHKLMKEELAKGVRYDSLFLGIYLGMPQKEFYMHCWQLNKKGLIRQGSNNTSVYYKMPDFKDTVEANFYPAFYKDKIWKLPVKLNFQAWAPWNREYSSDTLENDLVGKFFDWYGTGFRKVLNARNEVAYYKIDGNRLISIFKDDDQYVWAVFTDLIVYNELKKQMKNKTDSVSAAVDPNMF